MARLTPMRQSRASAKSAVQKSLELCVTRLAPHDDDGGFRLAFLDDGLVSLSNVCTRPFCHIHYEHQYDGAPDAERNELHHAVPAFDR